MTGRSASISAAHRNKPSPSIPGNFTSVTTTAGMPALICGTARSADSNDSTVKPASCSACTLPMRTAVSSSISRTLIPSDIVTLRDARKFDREFGTAFGPIRSSERTAEFPDDRRRDGQSKTESCAGFLGGDERFEDPRQQVGSDAGPGVPYGDGDPACALAHQHLEAAQGGVLHRVECIDDEVHEHLFQPVGVGF